MFDGNVYLVFSDLCYIFVPRIVISISSVHKKNELFRHLRFCLHTNKGRSGGGRVGVSVFPCTGTNIRGSHPVCVF